MQITETELPGVLLVEPRVYRDERGFFYESYNTDAFAARVSEGLSVSFRQDNHSRSESNVLRGLHYQLGRPQGKLVTCVRGRIFDVAVDIRLGSPTFGRWTSVVLDGEQPRYLWIPPGFAHGFCVVDGPADVIYKCTDIYVPSDDHGVLWSDPAVGIRWPVASPRVSPKDETYEPLHSVRPDLPRYRP